MNSLHIAAIVFICVFAGGLIGLFLHPYLPRHHLTKETQDVVRLGTGMLSVLASLVLGLLIATAKTSFDTTDHDLRGYAAELILANQVLRDYGQGTESARDLLRRYTAKLLEDLWTAERLRPGALEDARAGSLLDQARAEIVALQPGNSSQRWAKEQGLQIMGEVLRMRWQLIEQQGDPISGIILAILVFWIAFIFASFGLNAPRNGTVVAAFLVCSFSIGCAIFLVLEMDRPLDGMIAISSEPMRRALAHFNP